MSLPVYIKHNIGIEIRGDFNSWTIYIDGDADLLANIRRVQYIVDPDFRRLIFEGTGNNFECRGISPSVNVEVKFFLKDGEPVTSNYYLTYDRPNTEGRAVTIN